MHVVHIVSNVAHAALGTLPLASTTRSRSLTSSPPNFTGVILRYNASLFSRLRPLPRTFSFPASAQHGPHSSDSSPPIVRIMAILETGVGVGCDGIRFLMVSNVPTCLYYPLFLLVGCVVSLSFAHSATLPPSLLLPLPLHILPNTRLFTSLNMYMSFYHAPTIGEACRPIISS